MSTYYFVSYENARSGDPDPTKSCVILKDIHPLVWAARAPEKYSKFFLTRLLLFAEIPAEVAESEEVQRWCGIESEMSNPPSG